jgi:CP family cyanate transporter-like MFS transporter
MAVLALCSLPITLRLPAAVTKQRNPRRVLLLVTLCFPVGDLLILLAPRAAAVPAAILLGVAAIGFPMSLSLIERHARSRDAALSLLGVAQTFGYLISGIGTVLFGLIHLHHGSWGWPMLMLFVLALPIPILAVRASAPESVEDQLGVAVAA